MNWFQSKTRARVAWRSFALMSTLAFSSAAQTKDPAAAQALFDAARELMNQKHFAEACPKFAESYRLDPGIGTQFHLANCYEKSGRVASAWALFLEVASQARATSQTEREQAALERAEALKSRLPRLSINLFDESRVPGLEIRRDGVVIGEAQWDTPMPIDPGPHEMQVSAPGRRTAIKNVDAIEGQLTTFTVPVLGLAAAEKKPAEDSEKSSGSPLPAKPADEEGAHESSSRNAWLIGLSAVGAVGVGVGTTFAVMARSQNEDSKKECHSDDPNFCSAHGVELRDSAKTKGNVATAAFIAGGAALTSALGVLLFVGGPSGKPAVTASASAGPSSVALALAGSF